jgi:hypothetical protein
VALTMEIYAEAFPPGGDDANADAAARSFAAANGWTFLNRSDANFVIFFKREQD